MKIDKITLYNLTSIEGKQIIDFTQEPLRSAGLFAITGNTGSGKSTILDAVCLALYNHAPRFENAERMTGDDVKKNPNRAQAISPTDVRGILRRGCREALAAVEFTTTSGERYEAKWSLRLKRTDNYDKVVRTLQRLSPHKETIPEAEIDRRIPEIIGLDYTQFTRTVMLAQNSFANFLRAGRSEKSALLEKLTGTEIYGQISRTIHEQTAEAQHTVEMLTSNLQEIMQNHLNAEELAAKQEEHSLALATIKTLTDREQLVQQQLQWFDDFEKATTRVNQLEAQYAAANKAYMSLRGDELRLERYDSVLDVQPLFQEIKMRRADIEQIKTDEDHTSEAVVAERHLLQEAGAALDQARERVSEAENRLAVRRPAISRGHVLNGEIRGAEGELKRADLQLAERKTAFEERTAALSQKHAELEQTEKQLETLKLHQQALAVHRLMFDKFDLIKDKLSALNIETRSNEQSRKKCAELQQKQTAIKASAERYQKKQHDNEANMDTLKGELFIHRQNNQGHDSVKLQQRFSDNRNRLQALEHAQTLWERIAAGYEDIDEKRAEISRIEASQKQKQKELEQAENKLLVLKETYNRLNVAWTLSQSENIVQLRKQLKEGRACPVCGATHHPYHTETERELGELLNNLEKEFNEAREQRDDMQRKVGEIREDLAAGEGRLTSERDNLESREARQKADVEEWKTFAYLDNSFADCSPSVARDARRLMIGLLIDNTRRAAAEAEKELENYNFHQGHINRLNEQISALETQMAEDRDHINDLNTQYRVAAASAEEQEEILTKSDRSCSELYQDLDAMVTLSGWFSEWKNSPDNFRLRLSTLHDDWLNTCKNLDEQQRSCELLREEVKALDNRLNEAKQQYTQAIETKDAMQERLQNKRDEFARLFNDTTPEKEEELLQGEINAARRKETEARSENELAAGRLRQLQGTQQNLLKTRMARQSELSQRMADLDVWMLKFNATHSPMQFAELEKIFSEHCDWKALRESLDEAKKALTLADTRLQTARESLMALRSKPNQPSGQGDESRDALQANAASLSQEIDLQKARVLNLSLCLKQHEDSERRAESRMKDLEEARTNAEEWRRLDTLLGSADGKKFRELAQSYTFGFLVDHANAQLRQLSPRYELRNMPGTLTLEIIDRDMFDEHRYVSSLSGGETFVVSLALALGLATLSSHNLSIGSLFIDEGFGNLDHASLDLVMSALSNLENAQGRKVGVISHTDQIRSQISPQIRLVKQPAGGKSKIEIV